MAVGRVGRPHGRDGSFYVDQADPSFPEAGGSVVVAGGSHRVECRAGTAERPLVRLGGITDREAVAALRGQPLRVGLADAPLGADEWLVEDLIGCRIDGLGEVRAVVAGPSCDLLEVGEERVLVPLVRDAVRRIDPQARRIEVDRRFLGLDPEGEPRA